MFPPRDQFTEEHSRLKMKRGTAGAAAVTQCDRETGYTRQPHCPPCTNDQTKPWHHNDDNGIGKLSRKVIHRNRMNFNTMNRTMSMNESHTYPGHTTALP